MRSRVITVLFACAAALAGSSLPAIADSGPTASTRLTAAITLPDLASATPVSYTPNVYAGTTCGTACNPSTIYSTVLAGGEVVVAGAFTQACTPAPASFAQCPATTPVSYIFAFNPQTGAIDPGF